MVKLTCTHAVEEMRYKVVSLANYASYIRHSSVRKLLNKNLDFLRYLASKILSRNGMSRQSPASNFLIICIHEYNIFCIMNYKLKILCPKYCMCCYAGCWFRVQAPFFSNSWMTKINKYSVSILSLFLCTADLFVSVSADQMFVSGRPRTTEDLFAVIHR